MAKIERYCATIPGYAGSWNMIASILLKHKGLRSYRVNVYRTFTAEYQEHLLLVNRYGRVLYDIGICEGSKLDIYSGLEAWYKTAQYPTIPTSWLEARDKHCLFFSSIAVYFDYLSDSVH